MGSCELPEGSIVASPPFDCLGLHLLSASQNLLPPSLEDIRGCHVEPVFTGRLGGHGCGSLCRKSLGVGPLVHPARRGVPVPVPTDVLVFRPRRVHAPAGGGVGAEWPGPLPAANGPEETMESEEEAHRLRLAIERLSSNHREALVLRYYNDLTVPEIAKVVDCRQGTIKSRLCRPLS